MRYLLLLVPFVVACARTESGESTQADTAMAAPMALTDAAVAGTWMGAAMPMGSDSVVSRWTQVCGNGSCVGTYEGLPDTARSTYTMDGDSVLGTSAPFASTLAGGAMVIDSWVARPTGDSATGTGVIRLADMPDSVVLEYHFQGSRGPGM